MEQIGGLLKQMLVLLGISSPNLVPRSPLAVGDLGTRLIEPLIRQNEAIPPASCRHHLHILNNSLQDLWSWLLLSMPESILLIAMI